MAQTGSLLLPRLQTAGLSRTISRRSVGRTNAGFTFTSITCFSKPLLFPLEIIKNKVLIAVAVSAAIGQCSKPFTSVIIYRRSFDFWDAFRPAGFPSTHSSAAVAAAMSLGFERGLADSVFGTALVFACLIMYDAQGVRRQVGNQAKVLNNKVRFIGAKFSESVGHTKVEVVAGALLGFLVSVAVALLSKFTW